MARGQRNGIGCGAIALLLLAAILVGAWSFGAFDRLFYLMRLDSVQTELLGLTGQSERADHAKTDDTDFAGGVSDTGAEGGNAASLEGDLAHGYVYSQLSDADREKYLILLDAFQSREERAYPESDSEDIGRIRDCVLADHPELPAISGVQIQSSTNPLSGLVTNVTVEGQYYFTEEESLDLQTQIGEGMAACLAGLPEGADDFEKAKYFYEYLAENVEYDYAVLQGEAGALGNTSGQTVADVFVSGNAVCTGYVRAYQLLLQEVGIPSVFVTGTAKGGSHAWCKVLLDGNWYNIDPTWGDPQFFDSDGQAADYGWVNYDYLCVTDDDLAATHEVDSMYPLPECQAIADNYFVHEGLYLESADVNAAGSIVQAAVARGDDAARFRCADDDVYDSVVDALFNGQAIYRFIPGYSCSYVLNDTMRTVEVLFV